MALNWEKLTKLQRDYPKPKFAVAEVARQLKKKPNDPYLLVMFYHRLIDGSLTMLF
jgi:N-terminal acetyltransferase B complex non-catalytic subunit